MCAQVKVYHIEDTGPEEGLEQAETLTKSVLMSNIACA